MSDHIEAINESVNDVEKSCSFDVYAKVPNDNDNWTKVKNFFEQAWPSMMYVILWRT